MARTRQRKAPAPAPASTPGAGAAAPTQPIRVAPAEKQGDRQALVEQQQGAPLAVARQPGQPPPGAGGPPPAAPPNINPASLFAPTGQPNMPIVGGPPGPSIIPPDPDMVLRQMVTIYPHPDLVRLLRGIPDT
jgi:hypothetical protein